MVATPCPLILAVPIAVVAGISRAARRGIIVKGGGALETIARGKVLLFDKTGTLTSGVPEIADIEVFGTLDGNEVLRLAASIDQVSPHVLATAIVRAARERNLDAGVPRRSEGAARCGDRGTRGRASRGVGQGELRGRGRAPATARQGHPPPHQPGRLLVRVRGGGRHGRGSPRDRRPDPSRLAAGDPVAAPNRHRPRDHGHGRSSRRRRVGGRRARRRPDPVRAHARREGGGGRRRA